MRKVLVRVVAALAVACVGAALPAHADTLALALEAGTEREPADFSHPVLTYDIANITKSYDSGFGWSAYVQNARPASGAPSTWAFEGLLNYRHAYTPTLSFYGSIGAGERVSRTADIPYVTFRGGVDYALGKGWTWNVLNLRYRNNVGGDVAYRASVVGTGLTYRVNEDFAVYTRAFAAFDTQSRFMGTGLGIGIRRYF